MNTERLLRIVFPIFGLLFFVIHGLEGINIGLIDVNFTIDAISISLLVFASIPFIGQFLESLKAGDIEAKFRTLSFPDQVLTFLDALATKRKLTFYKPREGREHHLGTAGNYLIEEMLKDNRRRTIREIRKWINNEEENLKWFAAEVIGYFNVKELTGELKPYYSKLRYDEEWADWQLNCLWAHSKLTDNYKEFGEFLSKTSNIFNQDWALDVYVQMDEEGEAIPLVEDVTSHLNRLLTKDNIEDSLKNKAKKILQAGQSR